MPECKSDPPVECSQDEWSSVGMTQPLRWYASPPSPFIGRFQENFDLAMGNQSSTELPSGPICGTPLGFNNAIGTYRPTQIYIWTLWHKDPYPRKPCVEVCINDERCKSVMIHKESVGTFGYDKQYTCYLYDEAVKEYLEPSGTGATGDAFYDICCDTLPDGTSSAARADCQVPASIISIANISNPVFPQGTAVGPFPEKGTWNITTYINPSSTASSGNSSKD